jgi:ribosomal protein L20
MTEQINLTIRVNGIEKNEIINNFDIIDLGVNKNNIEDIEINYNSESHNITKIINKLKHSTVELL